jgi:YHS domain-containing protein
MDHIILAEQYRSAFYGGDRESLRGLLVDDFTFAGPAATYHGIDNFPRASNHVRGIVKSVETQRVFADGNEVCAILTLAVDHEVERFPIVEWYRFEGDRIASVQTIFDTGPFVRGSAETPEVAIDPVCHMSVRRDAAAAEREHAGTMYYFCNEGCAIAFEQSPLRYLRSS